jgi:hypothetical protein
VVAATYGSGTQVPVLVVNSKGVVTSASAVDVTPAWANITGTPTTIAGYGITDGVTLTGAQSLTNKTIDASLNTLSNIPNAALSFSSVTINGSSVSLGGSITVTATASQPLTIGTGLSGTSYNGSTAVTIANTGVLSWDGGTTGLTPATATTGAVTLSGTLVVANGGTGATTAAGAPFALKGANNDITSMTGLTGGISTPDYIDFDTAATVTRATGRVWWDSDDSAKTLAIGMAGTNATMQVGQETYYRVKASSAITEGQVVMFTGTLGASGALTGAPATGLTAATASYVMGVATEDIALNGWGYVTWFGVVRNIDTTGGAEAWVDGQILYYDPTVAGGLTKNLPAAPNAKVQVAAVIYAAANGSLFIRPAFGGELGQYEGDVQITGVAGGDVLVYDGSQARWENAAQSTLAVGTATNLAGGTTGSLPYQSASGTTAMLTLGTLNYVLTAGAAGPQYVAQSTLTAGKATNLDGGAASQIPYQTGAGATGFIANGTAGQVLTSAGAGTPVWSGISGGTF